MPLKPLGHSGRWPCPPDQLLFKHFRQGGASTGSVDMTVAGASTAPVDFKYTVPSGKGATIERVLFNIVDGGITPSEFGGLTALTNGLRVYITGSTGNEILDFLDGGTIKDNSDFTKLAGVDTLIVAAAGDDHLPVRWTIGKTGYGLKMVAGESFVIRVQDSCTGITKFQTMLQGREYDTT